MFAKRALLTAFVIWSSASRGDAQTAAFVIESPTAGAVFAPGSTVPVRIQGDLAAVSVLFPALGFGAVRDDSAPFAVSVPAPMAAGTHQFIVLGQRANGAVEAATVDIVVAPGSVVALSVEPSEIRAHFGGEPISLEVSAETAQGEFVDVSASSSGTTYVVLSGAPALTVTPDGVVTVTSGAPGAEPGAIRVSHGGSSVDVPVFTDEDFSVTTLSAPGTIRATVGGTRLVTVSATTTATGAGSFTIGALDMPGFVTLTDLGSGTARLSVLPTTGDIGTYSLEIHAVHTQLASDPEALAPAQSGDSAVVTLIVDKAPPPAGCGIGPELALLVPCLMGLRWRFRLGRKRKG